MASSARAALRWLLLSLVIVCGLAAHSKPAAADWGAATWWNAEAAPGCTQVGVTGPTAIFTCTNIIAACLEGMTNWWPVDSGNLVGVTAGTNGVISCIYPAYCCWTSGARYGYSPTASCPSGQQGTEDYLPRGEAATGSVRDGERSRTSRDDCARPQRVRSTGSAVAL